MLDARMLQSLGPEAMRAMIEEEEEAERRTAEFYGLSSMLNDISKSDSEYFDAVEERENILREFCAKLRRSPLVTSYLGDIQEATYLR